MKNNHHLVCLVCAFAAITLFGCETMESVDRGLYSANQTVTQKDRLTGKRTLSFYDRQKQIAMGNSLVEQMLRDEAAHGRKVNEQLDPEQYDRLVRVFDRVHAVTHLRNESWTPVLLDKDEFNASSPGGTYIIVNYRLMKDITDDNELASVIGHEIGHTVAGHVTEHMTMGIMESLAKSQTAKSKDFQTAFTANQEKEADRIGLLYTALAGYDPFAASRLWGRMFSERGDARDVAPLQNHPVGSERLEATKAIAQQVAQYYTPGQQNPQFESLLVSNVLWHPQAEISSASAGKGGGLAAVLTTAADAYTKQLNARTEESRQLYRAQLAKNVDNSSVLLQQAALDEHTMRAVVEYRGGLTLKWVTVAAIVSLPGQEPFRLVAKVDGPMYPGARYAVDFRDPRLPAYSIQSGNIQMSIDDVEPL